MKFIFKNLYLAIIVILTSNTLSAEIQENQSSEKITIVTSFSDFAKIAEQIAGDRADISYIASGNQDPHFVPPKPSYAMKLRKADLWITTGMDLEIWSSTLLDKARNKKIMDGEDGFVSASDGLDFLESVDMADRTDGDIHVMGNPHINTSPVNWKWIATNITIGLQKIDPVNSEFYIKNRDHFIDRVDRALFGNTLIDLFGAATLNGMLKNGTITGFLEKEYEGKPLSESLGGWLKKALPFRGKKVMAYHRNWAYFVDTFGLEVVGYIEPKPGIPPSARHVQNMMTLIKTQNIEIMLVANHFERKSPAMIEERTGIKAIYLPLYIDEGLGISDPFELIDYWINQIILNK